jgi:hypothetical protein
MEKLLQTITTVTVPAGGAIEQCRDGWVNMAGFETVSVFVELYGRRTANVSGTNVNVANLFIQNSVSGDYWEDLDMSDDEEETACIDGKSQVVFSYGTAPNIKGSWFRWRVKGDAGGTGIGEITFRVTISGGSPCR